MRTLISIVISLAAVGCATTSQNTKLHDPDMGASLEAFVRGGFDAMNKSDMSYWKNSACPEAVMWDLDEKGAPMAARGKAELDAAMDGFQKMMDGGATIASTVTRVDCRSSSLSGHCMVEFDQTFTVNGQAMGPMKFRGTAIGERVGDKWIWSHWHASLREAPPAAAAAPAAAPAAAQ